MRSCECCISSKIIYSSLLSWCDCHLKKLENLSQNYQNRRSVEMNNRIFETYKNSVMPHGRYIYATESDMAMATMCTYPPSQHALPNCKCVLHFCYNCPYIDITVQE